MKAHTCPSGSLANGAAARKTTTDASTTVRARRRAPRPAGRVDRNTPRSSLDRDCRFGPGVMASAGRRAVTVIRRPTGISRARRVRHGQHLVVGWKNNTLQRVGPAGYGQGLGTAENRRDAGEMPATAG